MREYILSVDTDLYGPYHSKEQAKFAKSLFISKHPDMRHACTVLPIKSHLDYTRLFEPALLH